MNGTKLSKVAKTGKSLLVPAHTIHKHNKSLIMHTYRPHIVMLCATQLCMLKLDIGKDHLFIKWQYHVVCMHGGICALESCSLYCSPRNGTLLSFNWKFSRGANIYPKG